jgi:hypothetical protein
VPNFNAWYDFWVNQAYRAVRAEKINRKIPYQVIDRVPEESGIGKTGASSVG